MPHPQKRSCTVEMTYEKNRVSVLIRATVCSKARHISSNINSVTKSSGNLDYGQCLNFETAMWYT